jgi:hypothetical protein
LIRPRVYFVENVLHVTNCARCTTRRVRSVCNENHDRNLIFKALPRIGPNYLNHNSIIIFLYVRMSPFVGVLIKRCVLPFINYVSVYTGC